VGEDEFVGGSFFGGDKSLYKLVHPKKKDGKGTVVLTVGGFNYNSDFIAAFNKSQDDYRIKVMDYWQYAEYFKRYILSCDTIYGNIDPDLQDICMEEARGFFAGEATAKQAAERIQNRCSILISEKSWPELLKKA
jgi:hypothetical protein